MAGKIDKPRHEQEGVHTFIGTGVDIDREPSEEEDDLRRIIREVVAEMLSGLKTETEEEAGEVVQNITTVIFKKTTEIWAEITQIWNTINNMGTGSGINVYKWISNNATAGRYNCYLQAWVAGAWANVDTNTVVVDYVADPAGHAFNAEVFFYSIGNPDASDIVPVDVLEMSIKKAYVKTTPGATTTLACYLDVDATGTVIDVACVIDGGGNLNACVPSVVDGDYIWVKRVGAAWVNVTPFIAAESCA